MLTVLFEKLTEGNKRDLSVLIVHNRSLLSAGIESLLMCEANLDVFGVFPNNEASLLRAIGRYQPDVIILDKSSRITNSIRLLTLLEEYPRMRIVEVNPENNLISLYGKYHILITQVADFLTAVNSPQVQLQAFSAGERDSHKVYV